MAFFNTDADIYYKWLCIVIINDYVLLVHLNENDSIWFLLLFISCKKCQTCASITGLTEPLSYCRSAFAPNPSFSSRSTISLTEKQSSFSLSVWLINWHVLSLTGDLKVDARHRVLAHPCYFPLKPHRLPRPRIDTRPGRGLFLDRQPSADELEMLGFYPQGLQTSS